MIELRCGDLLKAEAEALVNPVNCVGVMGRGLALAFKRAFPENYRAYRARCTRGDLRTGQVFVHELGGEGAPLFIINFPTKQHWKDSGRLEYVELGLEALAREVRERGIRSIAVPALGCGLGGLRWEVVRPLIERAFEALPEVRVLLFEPGE
jgi:O-acetyl-ADP-ribose deacetylase (regulator of RNase III)